MEKERIRTQWDNNDVKQQFKDHEDEACRRAWPRTQEGRASTRSRSNVTDVMNDCLEPTPQNRLLKIIEAMEGP